MPILGSNNNACFNIKPMNVSDKFKPCESRIWDSSVTSSTGPLNHTIVFVYGKAHYSDE